MMEAKLFRTGGSMAVRLPAILYNELLAQNITEFVIEKVGYKVILTPKKQKRNMDIFFKKLDKIGGINIERQKDNLL